MFHDIQVWKAATETHVQVQLQPEDLAIWVVNLPTGKYAVGDTETTFFEIWEWQKVQNTILDKPHLNRFKPTPFLITVGCACFVASMHYHHYLFISHTCSSVDIWWECGIESWYNLWGSSISRPSWNLEQFILLWRNANSSSLHAVCSTT